MTDPTTTITTISPFPTSKSDPTITIASTATAATTPRPTPLWKKRKVLVKELSLNEIPRHVAWERRRRLKRLQEKKDDTKGGTNDELSEDLNELKGCLQLGFGFNDDEGGQSLTNTLPALDIYFAVNRLGSPMVSPSSNNSSPVPKFERLGSMSSRSGGSASFSGDDSWKICTPGETPQQVKAKLRHWAQAVACSMI